MKIPIRLLRGFALTAVLVLLASCTSAKPWSEKNPRALNSGDGTTPLQQARQLLNDTAVGSLGMLGGLTAFRFTLKLERCYSPESLREVFPEYRRMVAKSKGEDFVQAVLARVEELLAQG